MNYSEMPFLYLKAETDFLLCKWPGFLKNVIKLCTVSVEVKGVLIIQFSALLSLA
jgi:hypothetical protein